MEDKLKDKDTPEDMMAELKHLDRDKDDRIPVPEFKQFMQNMGSKMSNEENYLAQKFARAVIGTNNVDHCARL